MANVHSVVVNGTSYDFEDRNGKMIAGGYSPAKPYNVGDYAVHEGTLYRCKAKIASGEAWDATHWDAATVGEEIAELKSDMSETKPAVAENTENIASLKSALNSITDLYESRNFFDYANSVVATVGSLTTRTSPKVSVIEGDKFYYSNNTNNPDALVATSFYRVLQYDANDNMTQSPLWVREYTVPSGIVSVQFVSAQGNSLYIMVEKGEQTLVYEPYFAPYYIAKDAEARANIETLNTELNTTNDNVEYYRKHAELVLPSKWITTVGKQYNLYKGNALLYSDIDNIRSVHFQTPVTGALNTNVYEDKKRKYWVPSVAESKNAYFELFVEDLTKRNAQYPIKAVSVNPSILNGINRKCIIIGDSKVAGGRLPKEFINNCSAVGMSMESLGTMYSTSFNIYHEGRVGWSSENYINDASFNINTNAFLNNGEWDFSYYMQQQGYSGIDYVFINLGTNDAGQDTTLPFTFIDKFISNINTMIASIHEYDANIKIIIGLCEGQCTRETNLVPPILSADLNHKVQLLHKATIPEWDNKESQNIFVCPIYLSMDYENDYVMNEAPLSEQDSKFNTGKTMYLVSDLLHQNAVGYQKNADYMFAVMCYAESLG